MTHTYFLRGMTCQGCAKKVKNSLLKHPDVLSAEVNFNPDHTIIEMKKHLPLPELQRTISPEMKYKIYEGTFPVLPEEKQAAQKSWIQIYKPLIIIFTYIAGVSFITANNYYGFNLMSFMNYFMAGFFIVFSFFKFLDLKGFAEGYSTYDLLAKNWKPYGFIYPFIELIFGVSLLIGMNHNLCYLFIATVMGFSLSGVIISLVKKQKIECACLGTIFKVPLGTVTLVEDALMIVMSVGLLIFI